MRAPSELSIPLTLNFIIFCFTFFPCIWLIMTCVTSPISSKLRLSRVIDSDGEGLMNFGTFGGCAGGLTSLAPMPSRGFVECTPQSPGWTAMVFLPHDEALAATGRQFESTMLLFSEDTLPLVIVPVATACVGLSAILLVAAWVGGGRRWARWVDTANMGFHWICTILTWVAFGLCIRMTHIIRDRLNEYNNSADTAILSVPLRARFGNAVWLALVSAILLLVGSVLYTIKTFWGPPAKTEPTYEPRNRDLDMEGKRNPKQQSYVSTLAC